MTYVRDYDILTPYDGNLDEMMVSRPRRTLKRRKEARFAPFEFMGSVLPDSKRRSWEELVVLSIQRVMAKTFIRPHKDRIVLILSTAKGEVDKLGEYKDHPEHLFLGNMAERITAVCGLKRRPVVVCNACISGGAALILGQRLIDRGCFDHVIVTGAELISHFTLSGFHALRALSDWRCTPFDMRRKGLNLGEAVATVFLSKEPPFGNGDHWILAEGCIRNDASHISAPAKKGDGLTAAINGVLRHADKEDISVLCLTGTGTMSNDSMEAQALKRTGLEHVPANSLKSWFGHTLGASGVLETILTMKALDKGLVLPTNGFRELGVSVPLNISWKPRKVKDGGRSFIKTLSGFGGCNAALRLRRRSVSDTVTPHNALLRRKCFVKITPTSVNLNGSPIRVTEEGCALLTELYQRFVGDYPKFHKMDPLCRLGFMATELLLQAEGKKRFEPCEDRAVVFFNCGSSVVSDLEYLKTIEDPRNYYPSPTHFVYTLPNIVTSEIAIRNHYYGETSLYVLPDREEEIMYSIIHYGLDRDTTSVISGWLDYQSETNFEAELSIHQIYNYARVN